MLSSSTVVKRTQPQRLLRRRKRTKQNKKLNCNTVRELKKKHLTINNFVSLSLVS